MRLRDLDATFVGTSGEQLQGGELVYRRRRGVGVLFRCPCGCGTGCYVRFENPVDGGPETDPGGPHWRREGSTIDTLTLRPSVFRPRPFGCGWHGFITNGEVETISPKS